MILLALALFAGDPSVRAPQWLGEARPKTPPQRVVSFAPAVTDVLFALGAGKRVVGVTRFCDAAGSEALPKIGGYVDISLERVIALNPDLVVAMPSMGQRQALERLRERGVPVLVVFGDSLREMQDMMTAIGAALDEKGGGHAPALQLERRLSSFAQRAGRLRGKRVAVVVGTEPIVVAGPGTFITEVMARAGAMPATADNAPLWPQWSVEALATSGAQVLIAAEGAEGKKKLQAIVERALPAERRPLILATDNPILMRPGPRLLDDIDALAAALEATP